jgi:hypothetical protein
MITREQVRAAAQLLSRYGWEQGGAERRRRTYARKALNQSQYQTTMETLLGGRLKGLAIARQAHASQSRRYSPIVRDRINDAREMGARRRNVDKVAGVCIGIR